jgi:porin
MARVLWLLAALPLIAHAACADELADLKNPLVQVGITPTLLYEGSGIGDVAGGARQGATYAGNLHLQLALDGGKTWGVPGLTGWLDVLWITGGNPDNFAGDAQGVSNISAPPALRLYEAWLQYNFADNRYSILAGRYDLNSEFYRLTSGALFLNSSFGLGAAFGLSGFAGPSIFPDPSFGARFTFKPWPNVIWHNAVLDGAPLNRIDGSPNPFDARSGVLLVSELVFVDRPYNDAGQSARFRIGRYGGPPTYDSKVAFGVWYYTAAFPDLSVTAPNGAPLLRHGSEGAYLLADQTLLHGGDDGTARLLAAFLQLGFADPEVNRFGAYLGAGLVATGALPGRPSDQLGLGFAMARNSAHYDAAQLTSGLPVAAAETTIELTYLAQVKDWLAVQPDVQYVVYPNANPRIPNALVAQVEIELKF